jgi:RHS repeat-associated protein
LQFSVYLVYKSSLIVTVIERIKKKLSFGMLEPGRKFTQGNSKYRYGFNGQMKSTEIGENSYTAEFWEYNANIGRRWNVDPITKEDESPYATFGNNPINSVDPNGADTINLNRTTTVRHLKGQSDGHSDALVTHDRAIVTQSGEIVINKAKGEDVFRITNTTVNIDENGNETSSSTTTTLELNNPRNLYLSGSHNMKGFTDDRWALAAYAPTWLLEAYDKKAPDIGIKSAIAYQKDMKALPYITATAAVAEIIFTGGLSGWFSRAGGIGFNSFNEFKGVYGSAGKGQAWHHIVEQNPANIAKFGAQRIHNTENLIKLEHGAASIHAKISGYYSSKQLFTNGQTVREWLSTQSYKAQFDFGIKTMKQFGFTP